jgi:hypothetical protein
MENPCEKCIIKVNCTEVCHPKENYGTLLNQSTDELWAVIYSRPQNGGTYYWNKYRKLTMELDNHREDKVLIELRQICAKNGF